MPISKAGKAYYTNEQYDTARYQSSALEYARAQGYDLVAKGKYHTLREHDSMVFTESGFWFWNSRDLRGGAIEFAMHFEHKSRVDAVLAIAGERVVAQGMAPPYMRKETAAAKPQEQFELPERNERHNRAFAYLTKTRGIDEALVSRLLKEKKVFETAKYHNVAFVFENSAGKAVGAFLRGSASESGYKGMANGSDKATGCFHFGGSEGATVACVFEGCIDAMSYATLQKMGGNGDLTQRYYIASGGAGDSNIMVFLAGHPKVSHVVLGHDNDEAGNKLAAGLADRLRAAGYSVTRSVPKLKDFNEDLCAERRAPEVQHTEPPPGVMEELDMAMGCGG